ncbi:MAG TPA: DUF3142 domain-containing protein [Rudaea sp.]|nr:DUF3142 domain-containing protein [Rudaea sp.]
MGGIRSLCLVAVVAALGCAGRVATPLPQEAYVWQRQWTPALTSALDESAQTFGGYRVLASETDHAGALAPAHVDAAVLARVQRPIVAVFRLNGSAPPPDAASLAADIRQIAQDWRAAGVLLAGIEIDHDCATARLADYARLLANLRRGWPADLRLSITALPAWIGAAALPEVLREVDESVLQVHAVRAPAAGLFDAAAARRWVDAYAKLAPHPFRISLPAYGVRVAFDAGGRPLAAEAEADAPDGIVGDARELRAEPQHVARLLRDLERAPPPHLAGVLWFRLPTDDDRRAWSLATLRAVVVGAPLAAHFEARLVDAADGARDLIVANRGVVDAAPPSLRVDARACLAGDAGQGYDLRHGTGVWRFVAAGDAPLRAGRERSVGWLRCDIVEKVNIDATP